MLNEQVKRKRKIMLDKAYEKEPQLRKSKKNMYILLMSLFVLRICFTAFETVFVLLRGGSVLECVPDYISLIVYLVLSYLTYNGARLFAVIMAAGGVYTMLSILLDSDFTYNLQHSDGLYKVYIFSLLAIGALQLMLMLFILIYKKFRHYFHIVEKINRNLA